MLFFAELLPYGPSFMDDFATTDGPDRSIIVILSF